MSSLLHPLAESPNLAVKDLHVYVSAVIVVEDARLRITGQSWGDGGTVAVGIFLEDEVVDIPDIHRHGFSVQILVGIPSDGEVLQTKRRGLDHAANGYLG